MPYRGTNGIYCHYNLQLIYLSAMLVGMSLPIPRCCREFEYGMHYAWGSISYFPPPLSPPHHRQLSPRRGLWQEERRERALSSALKGCLITNGSKAFWRAWQGESLSAEGRVVGTRGSHDPHSSTHNETGDYLQS